MSSYAKRLRDFGNAEGSASSHKQILQSKLMEYQQVKDGVAAFNTANKTKNYIKDGIGTAKGIGTEMGLATTKKMLTTGTEAVAKVVDKVRGTTGGFGGSVDKAGNKVAGFAERQTSRATDAIRAKYGLTKGRIQRGRDAAKAAKEKASGGEEGEGGEGAEAAGDDALETGAEVGADVGEEALSLGAEAAAEVGLDFLDATGVGAVVGIPLQIATGVGMVFGGVELGKNLWNDFSDIFEHGGDKGAQAAPAMAAVSRTLSAPTLET
tara:strand:+ start:1534 stop:2331 length:798 start_codon:yes stop_codon:yes gene_type:complete